MGADETIHAFHDDSLHWLAETDLLEMLIDKLGPHVSSNTLVLHQRL
jgi:serine/threonine-protein phosphatase 6 regulatory subunit 3